MEIPKEPNISDSKYNPRPSFFERLSKKKMVEFSNRNKSAFELDYSNWEKLKTELSTKNNEIIKNNNILVKNWKERKAEFLRLQSQKNNEIDILFKDYISGEKKQLKNTIHFL